MGDLKSLLEDLNFQLPNNVSSDAYPAECTMSVKREVIHGFHDKRRMTEQWVNSVSVHQRQRSISSDSYFGTESVCDKLKKSFLKPFQFTEDNMEDLRLRMSKIKIRDSDVDTILKGNLESADKIQDSNGNLISIIPTSTKPFSMRLRSKTAPFRINFSGIEIGNAESTHTYKNSGNNTEESRCNFASLQSVDLIKDIILDENRNQVSVMYSCGEDESRKLIQEEVNIVTENFRKESLFPHCSDLKTKASISTKKLKANKIVGSYKDVEDYLETQFYLLKEDFTIPLKEGIADYMKHLRNGIIPDEVKNLKLYHNVCVLDPCTRQNKLGIDFDLGLDAEEEINDKDFMHGSLVLITPNHFKDIFMGIVLSHNLSNPTGKETISGLNKKKSTLKTLMLQLNAASHFDPSLRRHSRVLLAECKTFFQPYFYIMKIFQGMNSTDLPLKEFILGSQTGKKIEQPPYLEKNTEYLLDDSYKVTVMNPTTWPCSEVLDLNESQLNAFQKALSEKLVLIQGPPGTGKTYLGSKIAKALLQNKQIWNKQGNQPMLLMCQTNHALDQFMELLLPVTKNLIRIGSQSKSDILAPFNMREKLKRVRRSISMKYNMKNTEHHLKNLSLDIEVCYSELKRIESHGVLDLQTLLEMGVMEINHSLCFRDSENFLLWLEEDRHNKGVPLECQLAPECHQHKDTYMNVLKPGNTTPLWKEGSQEDPFQSTFRGTRLFGLMENVSVKYILSIPELELALKEHQVNRCYNSMEKLGKQTTEEMENRLKYFKHQLGKSENVDQFVPSHCLWTINHSMRWTLYKSWVKKLSEVLQLLLQKMEEQYLSCSSAYDNLQQLQKLELMRQAEVVGMTTSAAARLYPMLRELRCPIVIVEEAAEVLESHIVATVTKHCQHLILLGDHKQLRPHPASYLLSKTHFTDVSLFERLLLTNTATVNTLLTQHRMQPRISSLIRPSIYADLYDHECTKNRPSILGMKHNVFFFSHVWMENQNLVTGSYCNPKEAEMAVQLFRYLLQQGYCPNEICILTAYRQQAAELEAQCKMYEDLTDVQVKTIDNFQGEESKIVILSLVRNNDVNQIGFLKNENRTCVALSRARDGLFMLGNIQLLSYNSELWSSVRDVLEQNNSVGPYIPLSCRRHPSSYMTASTPYDLMKNSVGCEQLCLFKLSCGHLCTWKCHSYSLHQQYRCMEPCRKTCVFGHTCQAQCWQECRKCEHIVLKKLACGHIAYMQCYVETRKYLCQVEVIKQMGSASQGLRMLCWMSSMSQM